MYFRATDPGSLKEIFSEIDRWGKSELSSRRIVNARELFPWFTGSGLFWLLAVGIARLSFLRELP